ncbi:MAG: protein kinase, partial [Cyanobacteria bacterium]|nr:protein kinase [Cyanobacteriota bacterium]
MNLEIGAVFADKYLIQSRLGEGGMGAVYKASQISADRTVAIKFIHNDSFNRQETAERFWREGKLLCELNHPSIPRFYHCGIEKSANTEAPDLYLVMEYVEGRNLRDELERTSSYLPMECLEIFIKIANALA